SPSSRLASNLNVTAPSPTSKTPPTNSPATTPNCSCPVTPSTTPNPSPSNSAPAPPTLGCPCPTSTTLSAAAASSRWLPPSAAPTTNSASPSPAVTCFPTPVAPLPVQVVPLPLAAASSFHSLTISTFVPSNKSRTGIRTATVWAWPRSPLKPAPSAILAISI